MVLVVVARLKTMLSARTDGLRSPTVLVMEQTKFEVVTTSTATPLEEIPAGVVVTKSMRVVTAVLLVALVPVTVRGIVSTLDILVPTSSTEVAVTA